MREMPGFGGPADGQRLDVEGAATEQRRDAIEHAGLVFDQGNECVMHVLPESLSPSNICDPRRGCFHQHDGCGRRIIASRSAPAGTIGYTLSSCSTRKSMSDRASARARCTTSSTSARLSTRNPSQPVRLGDLDEVGAPQRRRRIPPFVEELLPLAHHAEVAIVDDGDVDLDAFLGRCVSSACVIWKPPSPTIAQTSASGRAIFAPMAAGTPKPMVPRPPT